MGQDSKLSKCTRTRLARHLLIAAGVVATLMPASPGATQKAEVLRPGSDGRPPVPDEAGIRKRRETGASLGEKLCERWRSKLHAVLPSLLTMRTHDARHDAPETSM